MLLVLCDLSHEVDDESDGLKVLWRQIFEQLFESVDALIDWDFCELHIAIVLLKRTDWILHFTHHLLPIVGDDVGIFDSLEVVEVLLGHVDFELSHIILGRCHSEQSLSLEKVRLLSKVPCNEPKNERHIIFSGVWQLFELF